MGKGQTVRTNEGYAEPPNCFVGRPVIAVSVHQSGHD